MKDCLVENHGWNECDVVVQKFQDCINTKYFEDVDVCEDEVSTEREEEKTVIEENGVTEAEGTQAFDDENVTKNEKTTTANEA